MRRRSECILSAHGVPRIVSELALLGHDVADQTVARYMVRTRKPPSQTWRAFLDNHVPGIAACGIFTVPTSIVGSQLADTARGGTAVARRGHLHWPSRWTASPILACCVIEDIGLQGWFSATGLHVTVKQPGSRGIPGFFVAIFPVVTRFDVCPVGWYNRRMELLGRTGGSKPLASLGVHEHWNNPADRQYSRNLGTGDGIELIKG